MKDILEVIYLFIRVAISSVFAFFLALITSTYISEGIEPGSPEVAVCFISTYIVFFFVAFKNFRIK